MLDRESLAQIDKNQARQATYCPHHHRDHFRRAQRANYPASSPTTTPFRVYRSYPPALSRYYTMARGDDALAGREERNVPSHRFEPRETDEKINFQGRYISIYNEKMQHRLLLEENVQECKSYAVPKGYTVYIRSADVVYWDV
ncbi:hypothetical protein BHE90_012844 [Fusarium euwallaceae]|uniref:Uncharacterized protein n=3 Tax=Fusarium solani species complex TaxID=232080 RepID=A0A430LAS4_9HYPO|nr:hypothetical protein CEP51_012948 [Fusarium floridanum]RSM19207.1 hypothetical protein CDV31_001883 [Fusarium ambrosium]RTE72750.1 hypothetical protein BHE90_012844 [Fusarium euwallaceae]